MLITFWVSLPIKAEKPSDNAHDAIGNIVTDASKNLAQKISDQGPNLLATIEGNAPKTPTGFIWGAESTIGNMPVNAALNQANIFNLGAHSVKVVGLWMDIQSITADFNKALSQGGYATAGASLFSNLAGLGGGVVAGAAVVAVLPASATISAGTILVIVVASVANEAGKQIVQTVLSPPLQQMLMAWTSEKPAGELDTIYWRMAKCINEEKEILLSDTSDGNPNTRVLFASKRLQQRLLAILVDHDATSSETLEQELMKYQLWCWREIIFVVDQPFISEGVQSQLNISCDWNTFHDFNVDAFRRNADIVLHTTLYLLVQELKREGPISTWDVKSLDHKPKSKTGYAAPLNAVGLQNGPFELPSPLRFYTYRKSVARAIAISDWQTYLEDLRAGYREQNWPSGLENLEPLTTTASRYYSLVDLALHDGKTPGQFDQNTAIAFQMLIREQAALHAHYRKLIQINTLQELPKTSCSSKDIYTGMTIDKLKEKLHNRGIQ